MLEKYLGFELKEIYVDHDRCIGGNCPLNKLASEESDLIDSVEQKKDHAYFHVIAMGAGDYYNENNNGDFFYEKDLKDYHNTFTDGGIFIQHDNKDPNKSLGKVIKAIYNDDMHRIELILEVAKAKSPSIYDRAKQGERLSVSMGVKVPKESCSFCGSVTKGSLANRCEHLQYMMHKQMPNGIVVYAINHPPMNFFDISFVKKPADTQGHALFTKVASAIGGETEEQELSSMDKIAELIKYVQAGANLPRPSKDDLDALKEYGPISMPKVMSGNKIFIMPSEALYLSDLIGHDDIDKCSSVVDTPDFVKGLFERFSEDCGCVQRQGTGTSEKLSLRPLMARTSLLKEASYSHQKGDVFGNSFQALPAPRPKSMLKTGKFAQMKVNFHSGESLTVSTHPLRKLDIPEYYYDLVDAGYAKNIMGILSNGNEKVIFTGGK